MGEPIHRGLDACEVRPPVILKEKECMNDRRTILELYQIFGQ